MYKLALIGSPIEHSISPSLHKDFAQKANLNLDYIKLDTPASKIDESLKFIREQQFHGFNVTSPLKKSIIPYCDDLDISAQHAKAVNTVKIVNRKMIGYSTDAQGLYKSLVHAGIKVDNKKIIILGDGAVTLGIINMLKNKGCDVNLLTRKDSYQVLNDVIAINYYKAGLLKCNIIINATSAGLFDMLPPIQSLAIAADMAIDLNYKNKSHLFAEWARKNSISEILYGDKMLYEQAKLAFNIWFPTHSLTH